MSLPAIQHALDYFSIISAIHIKDVVGTEEYVSSKYAARAYSTAYIEAIVQYALKNEAVKKSTACGHLHELLIVQC